ncbi:MAG TPA: hypothetical protein VMF69_04460 [Gemmataceae bacterium]|nr:hypothetical protein [Gemmataceae bacterium]
MNTAMLVLTFAVFAADDVPKRNAAKKESVPTRSAATKDSKEKPKHSPYAPSLPYLTKEEEDKLDQIVDRFMEYDIGRLQGREAAKALKEFKDLGAEAIPSLVRGLNRAAKIEHSCPVVVIAQKLARLLAASEDQELMEFVKDEIGSGVGPTRHAGVLKDLRFAVSLRKNALARQAAAPSGPKTPRAMSVTELADAASIERGPRLRSILIELEKRRGQEVGPALANAAASYDKEIQKLGRDLLDRHLSRQSEAVVKEKLNHDLVEMRKSAVRVITTKVPRLGGELIDLLGDDKDEVRAAAHEALVKLSRGQDFGPAADAGKEQIAEAQAKWRSWWERKSSRR